MGEKLQSIDIFSGVAEFDEESFIARVEDHFDIFVEDNLEIDEANELWDEIEMNVLCHSENEYEAYAAVNNFHYEIGGEVFEFTDFFDSGGTETCTFRYIWCLYAIVWGIQQYDLAKQEVAA